MINTHPRPLPAFRRPQEKIKPRRLQKGKALTIAIGFRCQDGIILCSDREVANTQYSYYQSKLIQTGPEETPIVVVQAAADADDIYTIAERLSTKIGKQKKSTDQIRADIQEVLTNFKTWDPTFCEHESLIAMIPNPSPSVIGTDPHGLILWKTCNDKISSIFQRSCIIGAGNSALTQYLLHLFLQQRDSITMEQAEIYGIYIVRQAKKFIPGCGNFGPTDVISLSLKTGYQSQMDAKMVEEVETHLEGLEQQASSLFSTLTNTLSGDAYYEACVNNLSETLKVLRDKKKTLKAFR